MIGCQASALIEAFSSLPPTRTTLREIKEFNFLMDREHTLKLKRLPFSPKLYSKDNGVVNKQLP